jgi:hypothetical protein
MSSNSQNRRACLFDVKNDSFAHLG